MGILVLVVQERLAWESLEETGGYDYVCLPLMMNQTNIFWSTGT